MHYLLARLTMLLTGHWKLAASHMSATRWDFAAHGPVVLAVGAIAAFVVAVLCYVRTTEGISPLARILLSGLRFVALLALLVIVSGLALSIDVVDTQLPRMLVVIDDSPSMNLPAGASTRVAAAHHALDDEGLRGRLSAQFDLHIANTSGATTPTGNKPQNLAAALVREASTPSDRPISHILLISDGAQLGSTELLRAAAELPAPVSTLCAGDANVTDVILQSIAVPPYVYEGDRALVTAEIRSLGYTGDATLQLFHLSNGSETAVALPDPHIKLKAGDEPTAARVQFIASTAGVQRYKLRVVPVQNELTDRNNEIIFHLDVRSEKIRVLFIEGSPSWEYKFIREAMQKDPAIDFFGLVRLPGDEWLYQEGHAKRPDGKPVIASPKDGFPASADELNFFDVLIVGDLERKIFERENRYQLVETFVKDHAGGLVTIGGFKVYGAGDYAGTPLAHMLPFEIEKEKKEQLINRYVPQLTASGLMHPTMQLELDPVHNAEAWAKMPWVEGGNAIRQVKPSATLLMVHPKLKTTSGPRPIMAAWQYGAGRVLSSAMDGTWHWSTARESDEVNYHARYWGLIARWLASDPRSAAASLVLEDPALEVAKPMTVSLQLHDKDGMPITDADVDFTVTAPAGEKNKTPASFSLRSKSDRSVPGRYSLTFTPTDAGEYSITSTTHRPDDQQGKQATQKASYLVGPSRAEFLDPRVDAKALSDLATASGGQSALLANHATLALPKPLTKAERGASVTHAMVNVWQSPGLMGVVIVALSIEWFLRKRRGLS